MTRRQRRRKRDRVRWRLRRVVLVACAPGEPADLAFELHTIGVVIGTQWD